MGSLVDIRGKPFERSIPCRNQAAIIENDGKIVPRAGRRDAEECLQVGRRSHLARRLPTNPGIDVRGWRRIHASPNDGAVHEDIKKRIVRGGPIEI
ncbi:MAG: hypothetical protein KAS38_15680, partial [Anaerolineales bacterium]|nr:hypothetical protein [Anaerolineales bacterium]